MFVFLGAVIAVSLIGFFITVPKDLDNNLLVFVCLRIAAFAVVVVKCLHFMQLIYFQ